MFGSPHKRKRRKLHYMKGFHHFVGASKVTKQRAKRKARRDARKETHDIR